MGGALGLPVMLSIGVFSLDSPVAGRPGESERFSFSTYRERGSALTVLVDGHRASLRTDDPYIPLPVAIGWRGSGRLELTPEAFLLVDGQGSADPAAS